MQVTIALLKNAMIKSSSDRFLVDGFPRALDQAEIFERDIMPCQMVHMTPLPSPPFLPFILPHVASSAVRCLAICLLSSISIIHNCYMA